MMKLKTIDHATLGRLAEAGAVTRAQAVGQNDGWSLVVKYGKTESVLTAQRSHQARLFRKFETLVSYLKSVGIAHFDVDAQNYDPDSRAQTRTRPDSAAKMKMIHETAAYDQWLKMQIQEAIEDTSPTKSHHEVMQRMNERIAAIKARKGVK